MIIDLIMLYAFIVGMSLLNWGFSRFQLHRGLGMAFLHERQKPGFNSFFSTIQQRYVQTVFWTALHVLVVGFVSFRLMYLTGLLSIETAVLGLVILVFYAKDRLHYVTALLVMSRVNPS